MKTSEDIRKDFLDFFAAKGHEVVASDSLVPKEDPTLLFTNAGMNQFKDVFLETGTRPYRRATDTQKVLRVSGKHNDLEEVGLDTYHHTFFEMLGNWSFGDYFKKEAITWAWELLVDNWGLDPKRMYATVHGGDKALGLEKDAEAAGFWESQTTIPHEQILYFSSKDNFWMMGDTGPCGPCSEIHYDMRSDEDRAALNGAELVNADDPRVIEIWNLVFIQYDAQANGSLKPLSAQHVDTGMGFERMVAVMQGKSSNYDTDLFTPLLSRIAALSPRPEIQSYESIDLPPAERERVRIAMRVIADHARTVSFAIADGVLPGNAGRGYVIRRILRRAIRFGYQSLGFTTPFLFELLEPLIGKMGSVFPELAKNRSYIERVIRSEEEGFLETLGTGIESFERVVPFVNGLEKLSVSDITVKLESDRNTLDLFRNAYSADSEEALSTASIAQHFIAGATGNQVPGEIAFLLHDTYGFPIDLTQLMARESGIGVDMTRYQHLMEEQRGRARRASNFTRTEAEGEWVSLLDDAAGSQFFGYDALTVADAQIEKYRVTKQEDGDLVEVVLTKTAFYAESGGQVGDTGELIVDGETLRVLDTYKEDGSIVHRVDRLPTEVGAPVLARVNDERRAEIKKHHSVTHLMHAALREVLGDHVAQKGSLVAPDRLRFDFGHFERVSPQQLAKVSARVNEVIQRNIPLAEERNVPIKDALAKGATALFGEKYGESVRVISFDPSYSIELCGGTHVDATGEIGLFQFVNETSVAAGVRRVEAVAGKAAIGFITERLTELQSVEAQFKALQRPVSDEVADVLENRKALAKELEAVQAKLHSSALDELLPSVRTVNGHRLLAHRVEPCGMDALRTLGQDLRTKLGDNSIGLLGAIDPEGEKVYLVTTVSDDLIKNSGIKAGTLVSALARIVGGGGGGRPELATAGGKAPDKLDDAISAIDELIGS